MKGMGLGFATTARGACHLRATMYKPELIGRHRSAGSSRARRPSTATGKTASRIMDCLIYCRFYRDLVQWPYITARRQRRHRHRLHRRRPAPHRQPHHHDDARLQRGARHRARVGAAAGVGQRQAHGGRGRARPSRRPRWSTCWPTTTASAAGASCRRSETDGPPAGSAEEREADGAGSRSTARSRLLHAEVVLDPAVRYQAVAERLEHDLQAARRGRQVSMLATICSVW